MMRHRLRDVLAGLLLLVGTAASGSAEPIVATDILGRTVSLPGPARHIVLAQGRQLNALGLIHRDPISLLAGWGSDYKRQNADAYAVYEQKFPAIRELVTVGDGNSADGFSFEKAVSVEPDLVILSLSIAGSDGRSGDLIAKFEAAGIPVAVADFFIHPLRDTIPSLRLLGHLTGQDDEAEAYIRFYEEEQKRIADRLVGVVRPSVFIHAHAGGGDCCFSPGKGTLDDFIRAAGGVNLAAEFIPGATGQLSLEQLIALSPQIYVATGGTHLQKSGGLVLGIGVDADTAADSFKALLARPGLAELAAVRTGHAFGLWHLFNDTPAHIVAIERLAKWLHPDRFADIDPAKTLDHISTRFSAIPLEGTFWVESANDSASGQDRSRQP